jgi:eukaryotic-like serine/threonine-protein kinase
MDENNPFLDTYKKKVTEEQAGQGEGMAAPDKAAAPLRYEEKSEFVRIEPARAASPQRQSGRKTAVIIVVSAIIICAAAILIWFLSRGFALEDFHDWALTDAQLWASDHGVNLQIEKIYNDEFDEGKVISQNPAAGTMIKKGSFIRVTASLGHDLSVELPLPDLMEMTKDEIDAWVAENFMTKVRITTEYSDTIEEGKVISFEVNDKTVVDKVKRSTPIYIIISKGKESQVSEPVTVPNFKQMTLQQCHEFANENGIILEITEAYDDYASSGTVLSQSVKADAKVNKGDTIKLTVSKGKKILVPDFLPYAKDRANAIASELGITVTVIERYSGEDTGHFISQSIGAGTIYTAGDILELYYSLGNKVILSSFVGQTKDSIDIWAKSLNDQGASIYIKATYTQSNMPKNTIIYQDKSNTTISVKSTIRITVSLGRTIFVPDFVAPEGSDYGLAVTRETAMAICQEIGIIPVFVKEDKAGRLPGEIWCQSAAAGTEMYQGSTITLKYKPADATLNMPDFRGMTKAAIIAAGYLKKLNITFIQADAYVDGYSEKVYDQSVLAGETVAFGTAVTLHVSPAGP